MNAIHDQITLDHDHDGTERLELDALEQQVWPADTELSVVNPIVIRIAIFVLF